MRDTHKPIRVCSVLLAVFLVGVGCSTTGATSEESIRPEATMLIAASDPMEERFAKTHWQSTYQELDKIEDPAELAVAYGKLEGSLRLDGEQALADALLAKHNAMIEEHDSEKLSAVRHTARAIYQQKWSRREKESYAVCSPLSEQCLAGLETPREELIAKEHSRAYERDLLARRYRYTSWFMLDELLGTTSLLAKRADRVSALLDAIAIASLHKRLGDAEQLVSAVRAQILAEADELERAKLLTQYTKKMFVLERRDDARFGLYHLDRIAFPVEYSASVIDHALFSCESHIALEQRELAKLSCGRAYRSFLSARVYDEREARLFALSLELGMYEQTWELANLHPNIVKAGERVEALVRTHITDLPTTVMDEVREHHVSREMLLVRHLAKLREDALTGGEELRRARESFEVSRREAQELLKEREPHEAIELRFALAQTRALFGEGKMPVLVLDILAPMRESELVVPPRLGMIRLADALASTGQDKEAVFVLEEMLTTIPLRKPSQSSDFTETWAPTDLETTLDAVLTSRHRALFLPVLFREMPGGIKKYALDYLALKNIAWSREDQIGLEAIMKALAESPVSSGHLLDWMSLAAKTCRTSQCIELLEKHALEGTSDKRFGYAMGILTDIRIANGEVEQAWKAVSRIPLPKKKLASGTILLRAVNRRGMLTPKPWLDAYTTWLDTVVTVAWSERAPLVTGLLLRGECEDAVGLLASFEHTDGNPDVLERAVEVCADKVSADALSGVIASMERAPERVHYRLLVLERQQRVGASE